MKALGAFLLPLAVAFFAFRFLGFLGGLAVTLAMTACIIYSRLPSLYLTLAKLNYPKDCNKTFAYLAKAYKTGRMKPDQRIYYAYMCLREGRMETSERMFNSVLAHKQLPQTLYNAKCNYAIFLWKKGDINEAVETIKEVYDKYKNTLVYANYGYLLIEKGDMEEALRINLEAFDFNEDNDVILDNLAQTYYLRGEYEKSLEFSHKVVDKNPPFPIPYYNHARALYALGRKEEARESLSKALGYRFTYIAAVSKEEVERFLTAVDAELDSQTPALNEQ